MTALNDGWFTEVFQDQGTAFSLQVKKKLHEEQTEFQKLEIWETETFGNLMVLDGCVMLTTRDNFLYHEMMTHPALFTHKDPKKVVIVGGGDCGTLKEVLKHPGVEEAWQVEIDERVTRLSEQYFPELCESNTDPGRPRRRPVRPRLLPRLHDRPARRWHPRPAKRVTAAAHQHHHQNHSRRHEKGRFRPRPPPAVPATGVSHRLVELHYGG